MNIFKVIGAVITRPTEFFENVSKGKDNLGFAFGYFAVLSLFATVVGIIFNLIFRTLFASAFGKLTFLFAAAGTLSTVVFFILGYALRLGLSFGFAGLLHVWILICAGKDSSSMKGYVKTYELGAYAGTPSMLFGWVPFVGFIWSLILLIIGTQKVHGFSRQKAILMYVIPVVIISLIGILIAILLVSFFMQSLSGFGPSIVGGFPQ
jgi:hypothetical protein